MSQSPLTPLEWMHCESCMRDYTTTLITYYATGCTHIICQDCIGKAKQTGPHEVICPVCHTQQSATPLDTNDLPEGLRMFMACGNDLQEDALKVQRYQTKASTALLQYLKKKLAKYKALLKKAEVDMKNMDSVKSWCSQMERRELKAVQETNMQLQKQVSSMSNELEGLRLNGQVPNSPAHTDTSRVSTLAENRRLTLPSKGISGFSAAFAPKQKVADMRSAFGKLSPKQSYGAQVPYTPRSLAKPAPSSHGLAQAYVHPAQAYVHPAQTPLGMNYNLPTPSSRQSGLAPRMMPPATPTQMGGLRQVSRTGIYADPYSESYEGASMHAHDPIGSMGMSNPYQQAPPPSARSHTSASRMTGMGDPRQQQRNDMSSHYQPDPNPFQMYQQSNAGSLAHDYHPAMQNMRPDTGSHFAPRNIPSSRHSYR